MPTPIDLTDVEVAALQNLFPLAKTVDEIVHDILLEYVKKDADVRLQSLATKWRALPPDLQLEVDNLIKAWYATKIIP